MQERLKAIRKAVGVSQARFAELLEVGQSSIANWELGKPCPSYIRALICERFHVSRAWLEHGAGDMFDSSSDVSSAERVKRLAGDLVALLPEKERGAFFDTVKALEKKND